jgi:hypothetical protein
MVFGINPPADPDPHSFSAFQKLAIQLNGTTDGASASAPPPSTDTSYTTPPAQSWATATATITNGGSTWTSVYTSYDGTPGKSFFADRPRSLTPRLAPTYAPSGPVNHLIKVGADPANPLSYSPSNISAAIGDTVTL